MMTVMAMSMTLWSVLILAAPVLLLGIIGLEVAEMLSNPKRKKAKVKVKNERNDAIRHKHDNLD